MDSNTRIVQGLAKVVDDHIAWLSQWHQVAFYGGPERATRAASITQPTSFPQWHERALLALPAQEPMLKRLGELHSQLHTSAKLVLLQTPGEQALPIGDYEKVLTRFDEFITALRRMERAFSEAEAGLDPLTGLRTRHGLQDDFNREVGRLKNAGTPFTLVLLDIDHFKDINDSEGQEMGDRVLVRLAGTLLRHIRTYDDAYRLGKGQGGGAEFLLLMKGLDEGSAGHVLERLRAAVARTETQTPVGATVRATASFGYVSGAANRNLEEHLALADKALYRAKQQGRNRVVQG